MEKLGLDFVEISTTIIADTGLHIGKGDDAMNIGGVDNPIIVSSKDKKPAKVKQRD